MGLIGGMVFFGLLRINQQYLRINRNFLICFVVSASFSAGIAQLLGEQEAYLNTTITIVSGYFVFFGIFGILFYFDNEKRYRKMRGVLIRKELLKLISSLGAGEMVYIFVRWTSHFYFLGLNFEPFIASLLSETISTIFYLTVVTTFLKITKTYQ